MTDLVGHFLLFTVLGVVFLLLPLVAGLFVRPFNPTPQKLTAYECGEPTIGSSYIQFDLRFYVVALLFIIFDVEVAFFFPWAAVFGKATQLSAEPPAAIVASDPNAVAAVTTARLRELGITDVASPPAPAGGDLREAA